MTTAEQGRKRRASALHHRDFRLLVGAVSVSGTGDWLYSVALVVYVYDRTHSAAWVSASVLARQLAYLTCTTPAAAISDRFERRRWLLVINLLQTGVMLGLAAVAALEGPAAVAIALSFCSAALTSAYFPVVFAAVPAVVPEDELGAANGLVATVEQVALVAGPAIGAAVLVLAGSTAPAFAINGATFLVAAVCVAKLSPMPAPEVEEHAGLRARMADGVRALRQSPEALAITVLVAAALFVYGFEQVLYIVVAADRLHIGADGVGRLVAAFGAGGVLGSFAAARLAARPRVVAVLAAGFVVASADLALLGVVHSQLLGYVIVAAAGAGFIIFDVVSVTVFQRSVSQDVLARVYAIMMTVGFASTILASVVAPVVLERVGLEAALLTGTIVPCVVLVLLAPRLGRIARVSERRAAELAERADALGALGLLRDAPRVGLERLAAAVTEEQADAGAVVVREGDEPDDLFVVRAGSLAVRTSGESGGPARLIDTLAAGDWFGEVGLIEHIPRTATVTASTECTLWRIPGTDFLAALEQLPVFPAPLHSGITQRLARTHPSRVARVPDLHLPTPSETTP